MLIFKQETVISKGNGCIVLSLSGQKKMFNMCLKGGPGTPVVQRNLKIKLTPGQPFWWGYGGQLSNLYSLTEESQQHQTRMGIILMNISGSTWLWQVIPWLQQLIITESSLQARHCAKHITWIVSFGWMDYLTLILYGASLVAQTVKNPPAMRETWVQSLGWEDSLEEGMATHSSVLAWRISMDRGAWQARVHGVAKLDSTERLST